MALRFLADHCVSNYTVQTLREEQHEVFRLRDVLPVESSDAIVLAKAQEIDAVLISLDGQPDTVVHRHRRAFAWYWNRKSRQHLGRPEVEAEIWDLIRRMSQANPLRDAPRIHGELRCLYEYSAFFCASCRHVRGRSPALHRPRGVERREGGQTPDEMYFGTGEAVPTDLRSRARLQRAGLALTPTDWRRARHGPRRSTRPRDRGMLTAVPTTEPVLTGQYVRR